MIIRAVVSKNSRLTRAKVKKAVDLFLGKYPTVRNVKIKLHKSTFMPDTYVVTAEIPSGSWVFRNDVKYDAKGNEIFIGAGESLRASRSRVVAIERALRMTLMNVSKSSK